MVGGPTPADRNVISGHPQSGVVIGYTVGGTAAQGTIEGNYIGTDVTGTLPIPNATGVFIPNSELHRCAATSSPPTRTTASTADGGSNHVIQGNFIGTDATATLNLGNGDGGVIVAGHNWTIGGTGAGEGNVIAHNGAPYGGIVNGGYQMARIRRNRIFDNETLGIDLTPFRPASRPTTRATATRAERAPELPDPDLRRAPPSAKARARTSSES